MPAPGRPYTMLEMKMIVDYLVEHKAYGQVKARKMWQDFARSGKVNRTWQSLKETFIKRILPDIHNTYYKLTPAQKRSFKEGCDIEARESKNSGKLEMKTPSENSDSTGDPNDNQHASCSKMTGKDNPDLLSNLTSRSRASTDTIVLENVYETAEQMLMDLESSEDKENSNEPQSQSKTMRDYIAYSEPLTPMLQEVIDDFATDEDEPQLQIIEDYEPVNDNENSVTSERSKSPLEVRRSERLSPTKHLSSEKVTQQKEKNDDEDKRNGGSRSPSISKVRTLKLKKTRKGWEKKSNMDQGSKKESENDDNIEISGDASVAEDINKTVDKDGTNLTETPLPNNQEQLGNNADGEKRIDNDKQTSIKCSTEEFQEPIKKKAVKRPRSASSSSGKKKLRKDTRTETQEIKEKIQEPLQNNTQAASIVDTQTYDSHPNIVENKTIQVNQNGTFNSHGNQEKLTSEITTSKEVQNDDSKKVKDSDNTKKSSDSNNSKNLQEQTNSNHSEHCNNPKKLPEEKNNNNNTEVQSDNKTDKGESLTLKNKDTDGKIALPFTQDVVVLKSNSESEPSPQYQKGPKKVVRGKKSRDEALANVFGFASGAVTLTTVSKKGGKVSINPKYRHSCKRRTVSKNGYFRPHSDPASSDRSSDSESEDMSHFRNYIPPKPYNILSHAGGQFITDGNKVYPLVMSENGNLYHAYGSDDDSREENDSYWKAKYLEQKKRADELASLLKRANESEARLPRSLSRSRSPLMPEKSAKRRRVNDNDEIIDICSDGSKSSKTSKASKKTVKIKLNNKKEIELECGLSQMPSVLDKMASMFQQKDDTKRSADTLQVEQKNSRTPTPEVSEKVNRIEREIFKEIAEKDKIENNKDEIAGSGKTSDDNVSNSEKVSDGNVTNIEKVNDDNVTARKRGRPKKTPSIVSSKSTKLSVTEKMPSPKPEAEMRSPTIVQVQAVIEKEPDKRITRAPKKLSGAETVSTMNDRRSRSKLSMSHRSHVDIPADDPNVKYKFPLRSRSQSDTEVAKMNKRKYLIPPSCIRDHALRSPLETTQGYLDTDSSPSPPRKKRSSSHKRPKNNHQRTSNSHPYHADVDTCDSQLSKTLKKETLPKKNSSPSKQSSPNTSEYRSDSFQLLMPLPQAKSVTCLDKVEENSNEVKSVDTQYFSLSPISVKVNDEFQYAIGSRNENNSSNISLVSPEISVVEKMSVSKEMLLLNGSDEVATINETQDEGMEATGQSGGNHMVSDVKVGFPAIDQNLNPKDIAMSLSESSPALSTTSASILKGVTQTECEDQSFSDSLDVRLRDLYLESARKISQEIYLDKENMDQIMATVKKARGKRSSTPQKKRQSTESTDAIQRESVVIKHVQSCSKSKRDIRSCTPTINVIQCTSPPRSDVEEISAVEPAKMGRRQKDVIKVKIQRPRDKSLSKERRARSASCISVCSDSGINESRRTESDMMLCADDSVKLIHNHSVTCLEANECIKYDFQFPIKQTDSVNSSVKSPEDIFSKTRVSNNHIKDLLCDDALDASEFVSAARQSQGSQENSSPASSAPSTLSYGSIMTDDLSDESPPQTTPPEKSKWYILSEDETNTVNDPKPLENSASITFSHSNLKQMFTGYSIPNLSTISEGSREESNKPTDGNSTTH